MQSPRFSQLVQLVKWVLFAGLLYFVCRQGWLLWANSQGRIEGSIGWPWLLLAALTYGLGWLPAVWFWRALLENHGYSLGWKSSLSSHYCGHVGKYVPGKAVVVMIRAALIRRDKIPTSVAVVTATYETLASMAAGGLLVLLLLPWVFDIEQVHGVLVSLDLNQRISAEDIADWRVISTIVIAISALASLPVLARLMSIVAGKLKPSSDRPARKPSLKLLFLGLVVLTFGWWIHGLSLGCALRAVAPDQFSWLSWPVWTCAVTAATVGGFVILVAPGGLGIREAIIVAFLLTMPGLSSAEAVATAVLLRLAWFSLELVIAASVGLPFLLTSKRVPSDNMTASN